MSIQKLFTSKAAPPVSHYSQAVIVDGILYSSGQIGIDLETNTLVEGGIKAEATQIFAHLDALLAEAGIAKHNIIKATIFVTDLSHFADVNTLYAAYLEEHKPARSTVEVAALPLGAQIEIEIIAKL